jgi:hypothetical protein
MTMKSFPVIIAAVLGVVTAVGASTNDVFRARVWMKGAHQETNQVTQAPYIMPVVLNSHHIINLAMGRSLTNSVPANEVLAMLRDNEDQDRKLIVFDRDASSNLVTVADIDGRGRVHQKGTALFVWQVDMEQTGQEENGIDRGRFFMAGTRTRTNDTFLIRGELIGTMNVRSGGNEFRVIVPQGELRVRGPVLGQIIEQD